MKLHALFKPILNDLSDKGSDLPDIEISDIVYDSREAKPGCLFVCLRGAVADGHRYAASAVSRGASAVLAEEAVEVDAPVIITQDTRKALAEISAEYFGHPADQAIKVIGITGTKGKTTTAFMIREMLECAGYKTGMIGTIGVQIGDKLVKTENTTPESYMVQSFLRQMADEGCAYCVMEVSSIGLREYRVHGFDFEIGLFTNFSEDHIGGVEHKDMQEYLLCKRMLFRMCKIGVFNIDDQSAEKMMEACACQVKTYGFESQADYQGSKYGLLHEPGSLGLAFSVEGDLSFVAHVRNAPGKFNAYNALGAISCCHLLGVSTNAMKMGLERVKVKGRVEPIPVDGSYTLLIDYAHNALSMENLLLTLREYMPKRLICMFGAGGNRPKVRRYEMGEVCGRLADLSVITEDNSRDERVEDIIEDILTGMRKTDGEYVIVPDRRDAIRYCIEHAKAGDIIVLAGKGHEDYQEINGKKTRLDEREVIAEILGGTA